MEWMVAIVGWVGAVLLLAAYALLTARRIVAAGWTYQMMNLGGGLALMINSAYYAAWPSAALNLVWFGIGLAAILRSRREREPASDSGLEVSRDDSAGNLLPAA